MDQKNYFYFADLLFGETEKDFNLINMHVSNTFPNATCVNMQTRKDNEFETSDDVLIPEKLKNLFFPDNPRYLFPFDIILKSKDVKDEELFFFNLKTILQNKLSLVKKQYNCIHDYVHNFDGYRIENAHFKIGNKVHSADFYYAKRLFQNSFYTNRLSMHLARKINDQLESMHQASKDNINKITLVGYEMYSELTLSLIELFLKNIYGYHTLLSGLGR